jgi:hypothetical protein
MSGFPRHQCRTGRKVRPIGQNAQMSAERRFPGPALLRCNCDDLHSCCPALILRC